MNPHVRLLVGWLVDPPRRSVIILKRVGNFKCFISAYLLFLRQELSCDNFDLEPTLLSQGFLSVLYINDKELLLVDNNGLERWCGWFQNHPYSGCQHLNERYANKANIIRS